MIITSILVALTIALGSIALHMMYVDAEMKGYERGLDDAEQIIKEVRRI